jgi:hypothetical protein
MRSSRGSPRAGVGVLWRRPDSRSLMSWPARRSGTSLASCRRSHCLMVANPARRGERADAILAHVAEGDWVAGWGSGLLAHVDRAPQNTALHQCRCLPCLCSAHSALVPLIRRPNNEGSPMRNAETTTDDRDTVTARPAESSGPEFDEGPVDDHPNNDAPRPRGPHGRIGRHPAPVSASVSLAAGSSHLIFLTCVGVSAPGHVGGGR